MTGRDNESAKGRPGTSGYRRRNNMVNMAASVRSRLTTLAHAQGEEPEYVLTRYALERLLYRLGTSPHAGAFILKGALLFALWDGRPHRATRDLDLLGFGQPDVGRIEQVFRELCMLPVEDDGLAFLPETVHARPIREQQEYDGGIWVLLQATLGTARLRVQADVGFGDVVTPSAQEADLPTLLDLPGLPAPRLRVYPRETVVAEKFEAMVHLGMTNTRMKDFYDLLMLARQFAFDGQPLAAAIRATFARRGTDLPSLNQLPIGLSDEFADDTTKQAEWRGFLKRSKLESSDVTLRTVIEELRVFLLPLTGALATGAEFASHWRPGASWEMLRT
jgi:predicted nucleotidyltransferase component of viral defense system